LEVTASGAGIATARTTRSTAPERREKFNFMMLILVCVWACLEVVANEEIC
jgi:hypothetical protein